MSEKFAVRLEWLEAPGVNTPELAATWARFEIWVDDRCVTQVEEADGTFRRSLYGSLYPLAEWVAANWWVLGNNIRPSAIESRYWTWPGVRTQPWLRQHNFRAAGDGMAWPNLTLVPEGAITHVVWVPDRHRTLAPVRFASAGEAWLSSVDVAEGLARLVDHVLDRLTEARLSKTRLADEWAAIAAADGDERDFCRAVARLGLDPYDVGEQLTDYVMDVAARLPPELVDDFFDNASPTALRAAAAWTIRAVGDAAGVATKAPNRLKPLYDATSNVSAQAPVTHRPWVTGYQMARLVRDELGTADHERFDVAPWVGRVDRSQDAAGIQGIAAVAQGRCGLVQGVSRGRFGQARALGRALGRPAARSFMLSAAHGVDEQVARAFAAEVLAPAAGIRQALDTSGGQLDDEVLGDIAEQFDVSPLVIRHQYDNQLVEG